jgi:hypothetical protein
MDASQVCEEKLLPGSGRRSESDLAYSSTRDESAPGWCLNLSAKARGQPKLARNPHFQLIGFRSSID